jgi:hypothetical protein
MVRVMLAWVVAILVAFVGPAGASIGTFANIANDRVKDLRTRMLDAADEFVTAVTRAYEAIESAALPTGLWIEIAWMVSVPTTRPRDRGRAAGIGTMIGYERARVEAWAPW